MFLVAARLMQVIYGETSYHAGSSYMPELPEVETVCRGLSLHLPGQVIEGIRVRDSRLRHPVDAGELDRLVAGRHILELTRRAKYVRIHLEGGSCLVLHLGMSGQLGLFDESDPLDRHDHVIFSLSGGRQLRLRDPRRFGSVTAMAAADLESHPLFARLGVEPLSAECDEQYLLERARGSRRPIKNFLMDQEVVVGVGNIYASEALFLAGVHPLRPAGQLRRPTWERLLEAVRGVLQHAIAEGGTTLRDFRNGEGGLGYFQTQLAVYGREGEPCPRCQRLIRRLVVAGRSTFFCPSCQRR